MAWPVWPFESIIGLVQKFAKLAREMLIEELSYARKLLLIQKVVSRIIGLIVADRYRHRHSLQPPWRRKSATSTRGGLDARFLARYYRDHRSGDQRAVVCAGQHGFHCGIQGNRENSMGLYQCRLVFLGVSPTILPQAPILPRLARIILFIWDMISSTPSMLKVVKSLGHSIRE